MTLRFFRLLLACALVASAFQLHAEPTRIAVIYTEADDFNPGNFASLLGGIENTPDVEVILLSLEDINGPQLSQMLLAASQRNGTLRLAAAGGNIGPIAVFYPDIGEPYRSIFSKIIEGIEETSQAKVASYAVGNSFNTQTIAEELKRQEIRVVIALGRNGLRAASTLDKEISIVAGGVVSVPESEQRRNAILSLAPDPALLFARLKMLSPKTQRIFVVYEPRQNGWLIKLAKEAARTQGIELVAQEASDLKGALTIYQSIFAMADAKRDALWLPQDSTTVDESLVIPHVLQESWNKSIPVFSSNVSHVKRGALFALYPNNFELGRNLASSAISVANGNTTVRGVLPLREVLMAFNTRTASHLGLTASPAQQKGFDLLFPDQ